MRRAFLVGINSYNQSPLRGCVNDVALLERELRGYHIRKCLNSEATKSNILTGIEWLTTSSKGDDSCLFSFSGHGAQIIDVHDDEVDGYDEVLCPFDVFDGNYITDDELSAYLNEVNRETTFEVILDCCHSGTGDRGDINLGTDGKIIKDVSGRFMDIANVFQEKLNVGKKLIKDKAKSPNNRITLWSACRDYETAADALFENYNGAFTFNLIRCLKSCQRLSRYSLIKCLEKNMRVYGFTQIPQMYCSNYDRFLPFAMNKSEARSLGIKLDVPIKKIIGTTIRHYLDKYDF